VSSPQTTSRNIRPFVGYRRLPGEPLDSCSPEILEALWWRQPLATFLAALHAFPLSTAQQLGARPLVLLPVATTQHAVLATKTTTISNLSQIRQAWKQALTDLYQVSQVEIFPNLDAKSQATITAQFEDFLNNAANFQFQPSLLHGDFSSEHVLLSLGNQLPSPLNNPYVSGIIDFGELGLGDPAYDLWESLVPYYSFSRTSNPDPTLLHRCHFYKKLASLQVLLFAQFHQDLALQEYGLCELQRLWLV
jgi:aminoglycoside phosphotransferase (APT) family kinase protein